MSCATHPLMTHRHAANRHARPHHAGLLYRFAATLRVWVDRIRERQAFATLDYRDLRDLGLSQWEVERELAKPFWRD